MLQSQQDGPTSPRYIFNKPVDGHALALFGVKLDSRRMPIQSSLQRVEVTESQPLSRSAPTPPLPRLFFIPRETISSLSNPESRSRKAWAMSPLGRIH